VPVYRPAYLQIPCFGGAFWLDRGAELFSARQVDRLHRAERFDAILSYSLIAGGLAWRLGRRLGIAAAGWATGNDVRARLYTSYGRAVRRTLERLDLVFYQSSELKEQAVDLLGARAKYLPAERHLILPRGIERPPQLPGETRAQVRKQLGLAPEQTLLLYIGRIMAAKGLVDLAQAVMRLRDRQPALMCLLVGATPGFDDSDKLNEIFARHGGLSHSVRILPGCAHVKVWEYLAAADIFAFPSHSEGMPNSLLEAMAAGVPALAYAIPPVLEIDGGMGILKMARPGDVSDLTRALAELMQSSKQRADFAQAGKQRVLARYSAQQNLGEAVQKISAYIEMTKASAQALDGASARITGSAAVGS
jgi:glycosyltransferase involved in cell wall biosynthesis